MLRLKISLLLFIGTIGFSQTSKTDSLLKVLDVVTADKKADCLNELSAEFRNINTDSSMLFARQAFQLSTRSNYKTGILFSQKNIATVLALTEHLDSAISVFVNTKILAVKLNNKKVEAECLVGIANCYFSKGDLNAYLHYQLMAYKILKDIPHLPATASVLNNIAEYYSEKANYDSALYFATQAYEIRKKMNSAKETIGSLVSLGTLYKAKGNLTEAVKYFISALRMAENSQDKLWIARTNNNLSALFYEQNNYKKAVEYNLYALKTARELKAEVLTASILNNLGNIYYDTQQYKESRRSHEEAMLIGERTKDVIIKAEALMGIGKTFFVDKNYLSAISNFEKALILFNAYGDLASVCYANTMIAESYLKIDQPAKALGFFKAARDSAIIIGNSLEESESTRGLAKAYAESGDFKNAYYEYLNYSSLKDSMLNVENLKQMNELQTLFETEKKDKEIKLKSEEIKRQSLESEKTSLQRNFFIAGFIFMILLAFFIYKNFREKKLANIEISKQKKELEIKNHLIEEKQKEIMDSLNYAQRIQRAQLPTKKYIEKNLDKLQKKH